MTSRIDLRPTLGFLKDLKMHNQRAWFQEHRPRFEEARARFEAYVATLIDRLSPTENSLSGLTPKEAIFRLNRDLRFSKDKSPYKTHMSAYLAPGGRKSRRLGYYVHIEPWGGSMIAGGLHEPESKELAAWRRAVDRNPVPLKKILRDKSFRGTFGDLAGERLATAPKGFARDHPEIELLRLKQPTVVHRLTDAQVLQPDLVPATLRVFAVMKPFLRYLDELS